MLVYFTVTLTQSGSVGYTLSRFYGYVRHLVMVRVRSWQMHYVPT